MVLEIISFYVFICDGRCYYRRLVGVTQYLFWGGLSGTGSRSPIPNAYGLNVPVKEQVVYRLAARPNGSFLDWVKWPPGCLEMLRRPPEVCAVYER